MGIVVSLDARRQGRPSLPGLRDRARTAFHFDLADPGTYLAAERVDRLFPGVSWIATSLPARSAADDDLAARADALHMPLVWPEHHPAPRPAAMRAAAYAAEQGRGAAFVLAASRLAFCGGFDLDDPEVLAEAAAAAGLELPEVLAAAGDRSRDGEMEADALRLLAQGATRLPVLRVGRTLFCGEHRVAEAAAALRRRPRVERPAQVPHAG